MPIKSRQCGWSSLTLRVQYRNPICEAPNMLQLECIVSNLQNIKILFGRNCFLQIFEVLPKLRMTTPDSLSSNGIYPWIPNSGVHFDIHISRTSLRLDPNPSFKRYFEKNPEEIYIFCLLIRKDCKVSSDLTSNFQFPDSNRTYRHFSLCELQLRNMHANFLKGWKAFSAAVKRFLVLSGWFLLSESISSQSIAHSSTLSVPSSERPRLPNKET